MKNWKLAYKVMAINCVIVIFIGIVVAIFTSNAADDFAFALGIICLAGGILNLFLGLILFIVNSGVSKQWGKGFFNSAGILLLLSGISCGAGLEYTNFH
ncbi:MAG: hypothetical protein JO072_08290 [Parafilimonas sp.]|nr:hypothetical protein [Parafilimonas sp.]